MTTKAKCDLCYKGHLPEVHDDMQLYIMSRLAEIKRMVLDLTGDIAVAENIQYLQNELLGWKK